VAARVLGINDTNNSQVTQLASDIEKLIKSESLPHGTVLQPDQVINLGQIDNPYLDSNSNGLTFVVERMRGQPLAGHVTLSKSERSELAGIAATLL